MVRMVAASGGSARRVSSAIRIRSSPDDGQDLAEQPLGQRGDAVAGHAGVVRPEAAHVPERALDLEDLRPARDRGGDVQRADAPFPVADERVPQVALGRRPHHHRLPVEEARIGVERGQGGRHVAGRLGGGGGRVQDDGEREDPGGGGPPPAAGRGEVRRGAAASVGGWRCPHAGNPNIYCFVAVAATEGRRRPAAGRWQSRFPNRPPTGCRCTCDS